jgi:hypothetical protein
MCGESELKSCRNVTTDVYWRHWSEHSAQKDVDIGPQHNAMFS